MALNRLLLDKDIRRRRRAAPPGPGRNALVPSPTADRRLEATA